MKDMKDISSKLDGFIFNEIKNSHQCVVEDNVKLKFTPNRFDLTIKYMYLKLCKNNLKEDAENFYLSHIAAFSLGKFTERGNDVKVGRRAFVDEFDKLFDDIMNNGFNKNKSIIPLASDSSILNGAHRLASCIYLNKEVSVVRTDIKPVDYSYDYFFKRGVCSELLDLSLLEYINQTSNVYIAFIWPASENKCDLSSYFDNVVCRKKIKIDYNGARNLLCQAYKGEHWLGTIQNGFSGVDAKLLKCFPNFSEVEIFVFESESFENVLNIKENIRGLFGIGKHSIHITDNQRESIELANLIFNKNGLNFLNNSRYYEYPETINKIEEFKVLCHKNNVDLDNVVIDGSLVLSVYGLREARDIDYISNEDITLLNSLTIDNHNDMLCFYKKSAHQLIYNPSNHFVFLGVKFVSIFEVRDMKTRRNEPKDITDVHLINSIKETGNNLFKSYLKSRFLYYKAKVCLKSRILATYFLTRLGLYDFVRRIYLNLKGK